jgi:hypothetical protein
MSRQPKFLRMKSDGFLYVYTEELAKDKDRFVPVFDDTPEVVDQQTAVVKPVATVVPSADESHKEFTIGDDDAEAEERAVPAVSTEKAQQPAPVATIELPTDTEMATMNRAELMSIAKRAGLLPVIGSKKEDLIELIAKAKG